MMGKTVQCLIQDEKLKNARWIKVGWVKESRQATDIYLASSVRFKYCGGGRVDGPVPTPIEIHHNINGNSNPCSMRGLWGGWLRQNVVAK